VGLTALPASLLMGLVWEHVSPAAAFTVGAALALASAALLLLVLGSPASRKEKS